MISNFNFKKFNEKTILLTNDFGKYIFVSLEDFKHIINNKIDKNKEIYKILCDKMFIINEPIDQHIESGKQMLRHSKSYLFSATSLHIFVVTNFCNSNCVYCQARSNVANHYKKMDKMTAKKCVDFALQSPQKRLSFEFQGGEPLSNFEIIKYIVEYAEQTKKDKNIEYSIVSNLTMLTKDMIYFFKKYNISISTSIDGDMELHNHNRPLNNNRPSYKNVIDAIADLKREGIKCGAIQTTTKKSLDEHISITEAYIKQGMKTIFIRPLTPLGYALEKWDEIGYSVEEFKGFYRNCLCYIIESNKKGVYLKEGHATIFLTKILAGYGLNYMELRSPCGAAIGQLAYYYDGQVYTCDEGRMLREMGDDTFCLGNVYKNTYNEVMDSKKCAAVCKYSILESLPKCSDCAYLPYCGTCPVINYAIDNDLISRTYDNYRCGIYKGMLDVIFELIQDEENLEIMRTWI